jgi:steroid delta-isomerase-like uncharacterized protein
MSEHNKAIARRYFAEILHGQIDVADEIVADDIVFIGPNYWGEAIHGREGFKGFVRSLRSAFPDMVFTVHEEFAEGARVATRFSFTATHRGEWLGIDPTDKTIDLPGADLLRIEDGRIREIRVFYDTLGLMQQLGLAPVPGVAAG